MKISYEWLQNRFFGGTLPAPEKIAELLTMYAFEVESVIKMDGENKVAGGATILDVKVLPNRSHDCLSHKGIARELATLLSKELLYKPERAQEQVQTSAETKEQISTADHVAVSIEEGAKCRRAMKRIVQGVRVAESPQWLKDYLISIGQKPINNIVDSANFVMFETGQPVHTFDYDKISSTSGAAETRIGEARVTSRKNVFIRNARQGETIKCLDDKTYTLDLETIVIADGAQALDIAGVKGGSASGIDSNTKNVLLSACNFDPVSIRKTSKRLGLRTDASVRFENEITPELASEAIELLSALMQKSAGGKVAADVLDIYPKPGNKYVVEVSVSEIQKLLGVKIGARHVAKILTRAGFKWERVKNEKRFVVEIPHGRLDIRIKENLIEEIARLSGYEKIKASALKSFTRSPAQRFAQKPAIDKSLYYQEKIRTFLVREGFSEVYTYTFTDKGEVEIANPIASNKNFLRPALGPAIQNVLTEAVGYADLILADKIKIFEIGNVFGREGETLSLALGIKNRQAIKDKTEKTAGAGPEAELGDVLRKLASGFPGAAAIAELSSEPSGEPSSNIIEINLSKLINNLPTPADYQFKKTKKTSAKNIQYKKISPYPFIVRDIAVFVPKNIQSEKVLKKITAGAGALLVNYKLFDVFTKKFPDGSEKTSYAFRLVFQSNERTLTDVEVNKVMEEISKAFGAEAGWVVR